MNHEKNFIEYCDMIIKQYTVTISDKNAARAVIRQEVKDKYETNKAKLEKLFGDEIDKMETLYKIDTKQLINISRDKLREFKTQTQDSFEDVQL